MKVKKKLISYLLIMAVLVTSIGSGITISHAEEDSVPVDSYMEQSPYGAFANASLTDGMIYGNFGDTPDGTQQKASYAAIFSNKISGAKNILSTDYDSSAFYGLRLSSMDGSHISETFCGQFGAHVKQGDIYEKTSELGFHFQETENIIKTAICKYKAVRYSGNTGWDVNNDINLKLWYAASQLVTWRAAYLDSIESHEDFMGGGFTNVIASVNSAIYVSDSNDLYNCVQQIVSDVGNSAYSKVKLYRWINKSREAGQVFFSVNDTGSPQHIYGRLQLTKTSTATGEKVPGAVYGVYTEPECRNEQCRMTTDGNGYAISDQLVADIAMQKMYYVKEISVPKGFTIDPSLYGPYAFNVKDEIITVGGEGKTVSDKPYQCEIKLNKYDKDTREKLSGVTFSVYQYNSATGNYDDMNLKMSEIEKGVYSSGILNYTVSNQGKFMVRETATAGSKYLNENWCAYYEVDANGKEMQTFMDDVYNTPRIGRLKVRKIGYPSNEPVPGCTFWVFDAVNAHGEIIKDQNGNIDISHKVGEMTTNNSGIAVSDELSAGKTYYVQEYSVPEGYELNAKVFSVKIPSTSDKNVTDVGTYEVTDDSSEVVNEEWHGRIQIRKKSSENHSLLSGAEFEVYAYNKTTKKYDKKVDTIREDILKDKTAEVGVYTSTDLYYATSNQGKFMLKETKSPSGFVCDYQCTFKLTKDKTVNVGELTIANKDILKLDVYNNPKGGYIAINKRGTKTGCKVLGATYLVYDSEGKVVSTLVTNSNGYDKSDRLPVGNYIVQEDPKDSLKGFHIDPTKYPVSVTNGKVSYVGGEHNFSKEKVTCVVDDEWYGYVEVYKKDRDTGNRLAGATFSVYEYNSATKKYASDAITSFTTDTNGYGKSTALYYTPDNHGKYKIVETGYPDPDYAAHESAHPFQQTFQIVEPDSKSKKENIVKDTTTITFDVTNAKSGARLSVYKYGNSSLKPIENIHFSIYTDADCKKEDMLQTIVTDKSGYAVSDDLELGRTYYVLEDKPDENSLYGWNDHVYKVVLSESDSGKVIQTGSSSDDADYVIYKDIDGDGKKEALIPNEEAAAYVTVMKQSSNNDDSGLSGAEFTLYEWNDEIQAYDNDTKVILEEISKGEYAYGTYDVDNNFIQAKLIYTDLNKGKFRIAETKAPAYYTNKNWSAEFTIADILNEKVASSVADEVRFSEETGISTLILTVFDTPVLGNLTARKVDSLTGTSVTQGDAVLKGAVYELHAAEDIRDPFNNDKILYNKDALIAEATTDETGKFSISKITKKDKSGKTLFSYDGIPLGKYYLCESKASEGYTLDITLEDSENSLKDNGSGNPTKYSFDLMDMYEKECLSKDTEAGEMVVLKDVPPNARMNYSVTLPEVVQKNHFTINKSGEKGSKTVPLEGAGFKAYLASALNKDEDGKYLVDENSMPVEISSDTEHPTELFTNSEGHAESIDIPYGTYLLVESTVPEGYVAVEPRLIKISQEIDDKELTLNLIDKLQSTELKIVKKDKETGNTIEQSGICFKLKDEDGNYVKQTYSKNGKEVTTDQFITDETGSVTLLDIKLGKYVIEEVKAPAGYVTALEGKEISIEANSDFEIDMETGSRIFVVTFEDSAIEVHITKEDITTSEEIPGAHLQIIDEDGSIFDSWISDGTPHIIQRIPAGNYILRETLAPTEKGYIRSGDVEFTVEDSGEVQSVVMKDDYTKVSISKLDLTDGKMEIPGATLSIYYVMLDEEGNAVQDVNGNYQKGALYTSFVSTSEPKRIDYMKPGLYILEETAAPDGFETAEDVLFEVRETEIVQQVKMYDEILKGSICIEKVDANNPSIHLEGAEFEVTNEDGELIETLVTNKKGEAILDGLPTINVEGGKMSGFLTYTITETKAPEGYEIVEEPITFTFEGNDGEILKVIELQFMNKPIETATGRIGFIKTGDAITGISEIDTSYGKQYHIEYSEQSLAGVTFSIYKDKKCENLVEEVTTGNDGTVYSSELPLGTYYILETKTPEGFVTDTKVHTVEVKKNADEDEKTPIVDVSYNCINHVCSVEVRVYKEGEYLNANNGKFNLNKRISLSGVVFGVYANQDFKDYKSNVVVKKDSLVGLMKTNDKGIATMKDSLPAGKYYYKELETLESYELDTEKHEFTLELGNKELETFDINKESPLLNKLVTPTEVRLCKRDTATKQVLADVEFELYSSKDELLGTYVTDKTGYITVQGLPYGTYYFVEIRAQNNYILTKKAIEFTINGSSTVDLEVSAFNQRLVIPKLGFMDAYKVLAIGLGIIGISGLCTCVILLIISKKRKKKRS